MVKLETDLQAVKESIDRRIEDLLDLLRRFDPLELIARYTRHNLVVPVDTRLDDSRSESCVEYLISLAIAQSPAVDAAYPSPNEIQRCFDLVDSIFMSVSLYHGIEKTRRGDPPDARIELRAELQINVFAFPSGFLKGEKGFAGLAAQISVVPSVPWLIAQRASKRESTGKKAAWFGHPTRSDSLLNHLRGQFLKLKSSELES